jgi:transportin-1
MGFVKSTILLGLSEKDQMIRQTAGTVIASLLRAEETGGWPEALEVLTQGIHSQDDNLVEVRLI